MKRIWLFTLVCFTFPSAGHTQTVEESPIPYFRYSVAAGLGANQLYGDLDKQQIGGGVYLRGNYFLTHGVSVGLELQEGLLRGQDKVGGRRTLNFYHSAILGIRFQPLKYLQDDHLRRIEYRESFGKRMLNSVYLGAGVGALFSLQWDKSRLETAASSDDHQGRDYGLSYLLNTNVGVEIPLHSLKPDLLDSYVWNLVVGGQLNFSLDDELDGYSGNYPGNESNDVYGMLSVGVNLRF